MTNDTIFDIAQRYEAGTLTQEDTEVLLKIAIATTSYLMSNVLAGMWARPIEAEGRLQRAYSEILALPNGYLLENWEQVDTLIEAPKGFADDCR